MSITRTLLILSLAVPLLAASCANSTPVRPAGTLGMALKGDSLAPPHPTSIDYIDKPALVPPEGPLKWQARF